MAQFFIGRHEVSVDDKGRIFVPAEFRKKLPPEADDTLFVMRGYDEKNLMAYSRPEWEAKAENLLALPIPKPKKRELIRFMGSRATEVKIDRQGRIGIPRVLLEEAEITDQMVIIGALNKLEFWKPENCEDFPPMEDLADSLADFDIDL